MNFQYSKHARKRRYQRGIRSHEIDLTVRFGIRMQEENTWIFVPPISGRHALKCRRFQDLVVIIDAISHDIITVFRDRQLIFQKKVLASHTEQTQYEDSDVSACA